ncbi:MAG: hypothetical protein JST80_11950 [Bdellovibrionales bacterium]|nr:hypothetical protein [Bdellovibrionales bacterium]
MKAFSLLIAGLMFTVSAHAVKVGDMANLSGTISNGSASYPATLTMKVTSANSDGTFNVSSSVSVMGQTQESTSVRSATEIGDEAQAADLVANCAAKGGINETITLASGEALNTCKLSGVQNGAVTVINVAAVPFLNARFQQASSAGMTTILTLQSYVRGN